MNPAERVGARPLTAIQQQGQTDKTGKLGQRPVRQETPNTLFSRLSTFFGNPFSRPAAGQPGLAMATGAASAQTPEPAAPRKINLQKNGVTDIDPAGIRAMLKDTNIRDNGITEQMNLDFPRSQYTINGMAMNNDPARSVTALEDITRNEDGSINKDLLLAVSQIAHQGLFFDGEKKVASEDLTANHGIIPAGHADNVRQFTITRPDNGDVQVDALSHNNVTAAFGEDGFTPRPLSEDSFYQYAIGVTIHADSIGAGEPAITISPLTWSCNIRET